MFRLSILTFILTLALVFGGLTATRTLAQTAYTASASTAQKTTLTVSLSGVRNTKGQVLIWLWNGPDGFPKKDDRRFKFFAIDASKVVNGAVTTTFDVTPGTYAVTALHDENRNGKMDTNFLGIPKEGIGVSNNVVSHFRAPSFKQASFSVPASGQKISISLRY